MHFGIIFAENFKFNCLLKPYYGKYVSSDSYPNMRNLASRLCSVFGSTFCCEQLFSKVKNIKTKSRSLMSDDHLGAVLCIATSSVGADIDKLCKQRQCQISH